MELKGNNIKFTNSERKLINNTHPDAENLPGLVGGAVAGTFAAQKMAGYPSAGSIVTPKTINGGIITGPSGQDVTITGRQLTKPKLQYNPYGPTSFNRSAVTLATQSQNETNGGKLNNPITGKPEGTSFSSSDQSGASSFGPWSSLAAWAGGGVLEGLGQIKSAEEHLADAGTSTANVNGISYTQQNGVNASKIMQDYDQSTKSDFLTNPFRAFTKIFGRSAAEEHAKNAAMYADLQQIESRNNAYAKYLRLDNAKRYGNIEDLQLYAANGKLPGYVGGKPTYTAAGETNMQPNAKLSGGEIVYNKAGMASEVGGPVNNNDQQYGFLRASDGVLSNKPGIYGYSPADMFRATGNIDASENYMILSNLAKGKRMYNNGKLPKLAEGWVGNFIPSVLGAAASLDQMYQAYRNKPYRPNTYADNPYELEGLTTLAGLRVNPYPIMNQLRSAEARTNRAIDIAGGLSGSQRTAARLANLNTTQNNISNLLSNIQQQNNAYRANYAQAAINAGQASRQARMAANQWDLDYYSKAHAARNRGIQTGIANMLSQIQQYQANEFKRRQFNDTMDLYRADQKQRRDQFDWYSKYYNKSLPFQSLGGNQYGDPIIDEDMIYGNPFAPRALRKRRGEIS